MGLAIPLLVSGCRDIALYGAPEPYDGDDGAGEAGNPDVPNPPDLPDPCIDSEGGESDGETEAGEIEGGEIDPDPNGCGESESG